MDSSDSITALRLVAAIAVLSYASLLDWRTRKIGNVYWISLSAFGLALLLIQLGTDDKPMEYLFVFVPILAILSDVYLDADRDTILAKSAPALKYAVAIVTVLILGYMWLDESYFQHLLAVPVMMLFVVLMYMLDIVRGGADAKALIALSILFPFYPAIDSLPWIQSQSETGEVLFPFAFVILLTAAIIVALFPLGFLFKNLSTGEFGFPQGLLGYRMNADDIKGKHVWLMERIEEGKHKIYTRPRSDEDIENEVRHLVDAGYKRIWVTPKIPFIIPMLFGLVISMTVGNLFLLLFPD